MKDNTHGAFTPEMMKIPQATWIETFLEGVTDKNTGLPIFKEFFLGNAIDSGMGLSITIDKLRVFINKTLSILSAYQ